MAVATFEVMLLWGSHSVQVTEFSTTQWRADLSSVALRRRFDFKFKERVLQYVEKAAKHFDINPRRIGYLKKLLAAIS